jgi:hypothetical protein
MKRALLFVVAEDPRQSGRPAEAIRIAAGVGAWKKAEIAVYLRGPAVLALAEFPDELVDADNYVRYLPLIRERGRPVYVQRGAAQLAELGEAAAPFEEIDDAQLAKLAADSTSVLRF